ncbi:hypothetical protein F5Y10DRAFT_290588 [Nemania abortiva]|nr:hypothetical protein F5Y10DRAFT_290588 [Nemania abortiva]
MPTHKVDARSTPSSNGISSEVPASTPVLIADGSRHRTPHHRHPAQPRTAIPQPRRRSSNASTRHQYPPWQTLPYLPNMPPLPSMPPMPPPPPSPYLSYLVSELSQQLQPLQLQPQSSRSLPPPPQPPPFLSSPSQPHPPQPGARPDPPRPSSPEWPPREFRLTPAQQAEEDRLFADHVSPPPPAPPSRHPGRAERRNRRYVFGSFSESEDEYHDGNVYTPVLPRPPPHYHAVFNPVPASFISSLEKKTLDAKEDCPICIEEVRVGTKVSVLACGHWFHEECIAEWLRQSNTCPSCRRCVYPPPGTG